VAIDWVLPRHAGEFFVAVSISSESACSEPLDLCLKLDLNAAFRTAWPCHMPNRPGGKPVSMAVSQVW
jgi:hypothetical protein